MIENFCSSVQSRRRSTPVITSTRRIGVASVLTLRSTLELKRSLLIGGIMPSPATPVKMWSEHRLLEAHGIRNFVIDPASLQVDRRARSVKTDRIDTERLLRSLMAYLRGEPKVWSVVQVPSIAEEDAAGCTASGTA